MLNTAYLPRDSSSGALDESARRNSVGVDRANMVRGVLGLKRLENALKNRGLLILTSYTYFTESVPVMWSSAELKDSGLGRLPTVCLHRTNIVYHRV